jgi:hypothetical protein
MGLAVVTPQHLAQATGMCDRVWTIVHRQHRVNAL